MKPIGIAGTAWANSEALRGAKASPAAKVYPVGRSQPLPEWRALSKGTIFTIETLHCSRSAAPDASPAARLKIKALELRSWVAQAINTPLTVMTEPTGVGPDSMARNERPWRNLFTALTRQSPKMLRRVPTNNPDLALFRGSSTRQAIDASRTKATRSMS